MSDYRPRTVHELTREWWEKHREANSIIYETSSKTPLCALYRFPNLTQDQLDKVNALLDGPPSAEALNILKDL